MPENDKVKRFLSWVNADDGPPHAEEPDDDDDDHDAPHYDEEEMDSEPVAPVAKVDPNTLIEGYAEDDEFEYPDELYEEDGEAREAVPITRAQKIKMRRFRVFYFVLSAVVTLNVIAVLLLTVHYLPPFGSPENPAVNEVYHRYVEQGTEDTAALNIVAAILFSYRSFDTLGEAFVLFTAAIGVILLMRQPKGDAKAGKSGKAGV